MELHAIVVGAGPAGLSAALTLGRMRRRVVVVDAGEPRNGYTDHLHNFATRDGTAPAEFRRLARADVERYPTVSVRDARATGARATDTGVGVTLEGGETLDALRLVLAGGIKDVLPPIEGLAELFGTSVFTCPYCDGHEAAGAPIGVICTGPGQLSHGAGLLAMLSDDVTAYANGVPVSAEERDTAERLGVRVVEERIARLSVEDGALGAVVLADGSEERPERLFVRTEVRPSSPLAEQLGCRTTEDGFVEVDELGRTSVPRVYAAGDLASPMHQVVVAAASGARAALGANHDALAAFEIA